ncbi:Carbohydrate sulfotransferase 11 [Takifugu flavidus]|uniref:Carbohydrate sulfotransferase 11 n=1 Tax=Takifugu flavidus TaxID=433684 RepID=A0A5C6NC29_9TELE|nr:Carbohydrate sulfotransferase 11 [Takifugu flavidus]
MVEPEVSPLPPLSPLFLLFNDKLNKLPVLIGVSCVFTVMRRNPFVVDGCCRKGSRNALQELYNPTEVKKCSRQGRVNTLLPWSSRSSGAGGHAQDLGPLSLTFDPHVPFMLIAETGG